MNNLARLSNMLADVADAVSQTALYGVYARALEEVSREFERATDRSFAATVATRVVSVPAPCEANDWGRSLLLSDDLISVSALKVDYDWDRIYEMTLAEGVDFDLWNDNRVNEPYYRIDLRPFSSVLNAFPTGPRRVQISGTWGYSYETEDTGQTVANATSISSSATALTVPQADAIDSGETLVIGNEQLHVSDRPDNVTLTVVRAINGTTAAAHLNGAAILRRRYPRDIEQAVAERAVGKRWDNQSGQAGMATLLGDASGAAGTTTIRASYARWRTVTEAYRRRW
jgi:hypothetical protein